MLSTVGFIFLPCYFDIYVCSLFFLHGSPGATNNREVKIPRFRFTGTSIAILFNISDINWNNISPQSDSLLENLLIDIVHEHFFSQIVNEPTRGSNILDLVLTTSTDHIQDVQVGEPFSDHN
jgi:hypothetical protein